MICLRYGAAQKESMPVGNYEWVPVETVDNWRNWTNDQEFGYMIECDVS